MRGVILAGGTGSRLGASTRVVNKHCLPVYDRPMVCWAADVLRSNSIGDVTVVSTPQGIGQIAQVLGEAYTYRVQASPGGIVQALMCADDGRREPVVVLLGDNLFLPFPRVGVGSGSVCCFLHKSTRHDLTQFGVPVFANVGIDERPRIDHVEEKPADPQSEYAVTGLYLFPGDVFDVAKFVTASGRGEREVTDLLNLYADVQRLRHVVHDGIWGDAGTPDGLVYCSVAACNYEAQGR